MALSIETFAELALSILSPLPYYFKSPEGAIELFRRLGFDPAGPQFAAVMGDLTALSTDINDLIARIDLIRGGGGELVDWLLLVGDVLDVHERLRALPNVLAALALPASFVPRLLDLLLADMLYQSTPSVFRLLQVLGVVHDEDVPAGTDGTQIDHVRTIFEWNRLPQISQDPRLWAEQVYGWGTSDFAPGLLLIRLSSLFDQLGRHTRLLDMNPGLVDRFYPSAILARRPPTMVKVPFHTGSNAGVAFEIGVVGIPIGGTQPPIATDTGLGLMPYAEGIAEGTLALPDDFELQFSGSGSVAGGAVLAIRPHSGVDLSVGTAGGVAAQAGDLALRLRKRGPSGAPFVILGAAGGMRLEAAAFLAETTLRAGKFEIALGVEGVKLVLDFGEDPLLSQLLAAPIEIDARELIVGWGPESGVTFRGGVGLKIQLSINQTIGPIFISELGLAVAVEGAGIELGATVSGALALGPLVATVSDVGLRVGIAFGKPGVLGGSDLAFAFKPPSGIGLSMSTDVVRLAGFLKADTAAGFYAGAIELSIKDVLDLSAIGLLNAPMPGKTSGFSLLFIVNTEFPVPIHIAFNFFFAGVGGILGLHRSADLDRLRSGIRTGTLESVLFPRDIVRNMDRIVADLQSVFPAEEGQFIIGPVARFTWNVPPLLVGDIGLIVELGETVRVAILGVIRAALPTEDEALVQLKVAFLGSIDFGRGLLAFDASIYDSFIGLGPFKISLEGDIAVRLSWGERPEFAITVGGFHPRYTPPAHLMLNDVRRVKISLLRDNPRVTLTCYFAITTNTVQFGAQLDFYFAISAFNVVGLLGFDVLFQFSPFRIIASMRAMVAVRMGTSELFCIELALEVEGPTPWIARGTARFSILFFTIKVRVEVTVGERREVTLPDVEVLPKLIKAFERAAAWKATLAAGATRLVQLALPDVPADVVLLDAAGTLTVEQTQVPLDTELSRFGNAAPSDITSARVHAISFGSAAITASSVPPLGVTTAPFAPATFRAMTDTEKLSAPAFEQRTSGASASGAQELATDLIVGRVIEYERLIQDKARAPGTAAQRSMAVPQQASFQAMADRGSVGRAARARSRTAAKERGRVARLAVREERFSVVDARDLAVVGAGSDNLARSDAEARLSTLVAGGRARATLEIVPAHQAVR